MSFIDTKNNCVNLQIFEYRKPGQESPSDPDFQFITGKEPERFAKVGLTHEIIGPDEDGGPMLICACANGRMAQVIKKALELTQKL